MLRSQLFKKEFIYPDTWDEDDKIKFQYYLKEAKQLYEKLPENFITLCIEQEINEKKGLVKPIDYSQLKDLETKIPLYEEFQSIEINS